MCAIRSGRAATFTTLAECNRQAWLWRDQVAHQRRWPGDDSRTVAEVFAEEQPRLLPPPLHPFTTDRIEAVRSHKTIYVRFDLNDYSIPPEAVGRPLTLVASDTLVRILDGTAEIARHQRTYDRHQLVLDPAHQEAVLKTKRKAFHATPGGRLEQAVPESKTLLDLAFAQGESAGSQTAQLIKLLDQYGAAALRRAIVEALERNTPRASSVAFLLRRQPRSHAALAVDLSHHPEAQSIDVRPHDLETYDELARNQTTTIPSNSLPAQLQQIGLRALPAQLDDFLARATKARWSPRQILEATGPGRNRRALPPQPGAAPAALRHQELQTHGRFRLDLAHQDRTRCHRARADAGLSSRRPQPGPGGRNGLGKTMIAQNICHAAVLAGIRCCSVPPPHCSKNCIANPRKAAAANCAGTPMWVCCASMKSAIFPSTTRPPTYSMKSSTGATNASSVIVTTNRPFKEWNEVFPNATCIVTLLDRLLHHADVTVIEGDSYRVRESEQETAARRRKK